MRMGLSGPVPQGPQKTLNWLLTWFFWPNIYQDTRTQAPLYPLPLIGTPFE